VEGGLQRGGRVSRRHRERKHGQRFQQRQHLRLDRRRAERYRKGDNEPATNDEADMDRTTLAIKARKHWEKWLPKKTRELKADGEFNMAIQMAARQAQKEIENLMAQGYQEHEAEEVVLPQFILLKPEPKDDWESRELAKRERNYQKMMRPFVENSED
jgi:hypothetical protein